MDSGAARPPFDFNQWAELARTDPEAFRRQRQLAIEAQIARAEHLHQQRLRGLQFRIDMECRRAGNPLQACLRLSSMMWDSFHELKALLDDAFAGRAAIARPAARSARIIPFKKGCPTV